MAKHKSLFHNAGSECFTTSAHPLPIRDVQAKVVDERLELMLEEKWSNSFFCFAIPSPAGRELVILAAAVIDCSAVPRRIQDLSCSAAGGWATSRFSRTLIEKPLSGAGAPQSM